MSYDAIEDEAPRRPSIVAIGTLFIAIIVGLVLYLRADRVMPREVELSRYPEFEAFLPGRLDFRGIASNLDTGSYSFAFHSSLSTPSEFLEKVPELSRQSGWQLVECSNYHCSFRKTVLNRTHSNLVALSIDAATGEILFEYDEYRP